MSFPASKALVVALAMGAALSAGCGDADPGSVAASRAGYGSTGAGGTGPDAGRGDGGGAAAPASAAASDFTLSVERASASVDLAAATSLDVSVSPRGGFSGPVVLSVTGQAADVTAGLQPPTVQVTGAPATARLVLTTRSDSLPSTQSLTLTASGGVASTSVAVALTVAPVVEIRIPAGIDQMRAATDVVVQTTAYGPNPLPLRLGSSDKILVKFFNADGSTHAIHTGSEEVGFGHGLDIQPNAYEGATRAGTQRSINQPGTYGYYLHDGANGQSLTGRIQVVR